MTGQFFISLLSPSVTLVLMVTFFMLWRRDRGRTNILLAGFGFATCSLAFLFHDIVLLPNFNLGKLVSNLLFYATVALVCAAAIAKYGLAIPYVAFAVILLCGTAALGWLIYIDPRLDIRIYAVNLTCTALLLVTMYVLRSIRPRNHVDAAIVFVGIALLANFTLRPFLTVGDGTRYLDEAGLEQSLYWTTLQFFAATVSIAIALIFLAAMALDLMSDIRAESRRDPLSGLLNRRGFEEEASRVLERCVMDRRPSVLLFADLDRLKQVNDTYGHTVGDAVISAFGAALQAAADDGAILGRMGGEEFAVLFPGADPAIAQAFAERVRTGFSRMRIEGAPEDVRFTASFGIYPHRMRDDLLDMISGADAALYSAKGQGRDRITVSPPAMQDV